MIMKHFGNSLSYEEIIVDMKFNKKQPASYIGRQIIKKKVGKYINGVFNQTGTREEEKIYELKFIDKYNIWLLSCGDSNESYQSVDSAKNAARRIFGNGIKWTANS